MNILFLHNNFPGQFRHLAAALVAENRHGLRAIGSPTAQPLPGLPVLRYAAPPTQATPETLSLIARPFARDARRAEGALAAMLRLKSEGFAPDLVIGHPGWGECLPLRAVFPQARLAAYCEYFYAAQGQDYGFDPEFHRPDPLRETMVEARNASFLMALARASIAWAPTEWQQALFPEPQRSRIAIAHEGIDTDLVRPDAQATLAVRPDLSLSRKDEVITYVARNLEPMRGFHIFIRALPALLAARPNAHVVVIGGEGVSYGPAPADHAGWKAVMLAEIAGRYDESRVHFLGRVPYPTYLSALQISRAHLYLTYPFVPSWSLLEAMAAGCVVVASDTAPVREFIAEGKTGRLVPFFDREAIVARLAEAAAEPERFAALGQAARAHIVRHYDLARVALPRLRALLDLPAGA